MKKKTIFYVVLWLAALLCCLGLLDRAMRRDDGERKYGEFFKSETGFDVLFLGTSRMMDGVQPMELWRDWGITSYNLANSSEVLDVTEQVLRITMEHHMPKVAMIDVFYVHHAVDEAWTYSFRHMFYDEIPLSLSKFEAIRATLPRSEWTEFLMPFSLYHSRWEELITGTAARMVDCEPYMMGSELRAGYSSEHAFSRTKKVHEGELPGYDALRRIAAMCREQGVTPVFVALPGYATWEEQKMMNAVEHVAQECGAVFLNLFDAEGLEIDPQKDCYDYLGHMNPDGASKTTAYIGAWLRENYDLADYRGQAGFERWEENLEKYEAHRARVWE